MFAPVSTPEIASLFPGRLLRSLFLVAVLLPASCGGGSGTVVAEGPGSHEDFARQIESNGLSETLMGQRWLEAARSAALRHGIMLREGVYLAITGPSYATRAELRAFRGMGADAVGMSTVFEVIRARQLGLRVLGISAITDMAIPDQAAHATGDEVLEMAERMGDSFRRLVRGVLPEL